MSSASFAYSGDQQMKEEVIGFWYGNMLVINSFAAHIPYTP
jgi:hypothetical protein